MADLEICLGVPDGHRQEAAQIYFEIFEHKFRLLFGSREHAISVLHQDLNLACAFGAVWQERLVGILGLHHEGRLADLRLQTFVKEYNWLSGRVRHQIYQWSERPQRPGELLMDGVGVDRASQGLGVGTALFHALFDFARTNGYTSIRLDVVDTNPRARRLYERLGFVPTNTWRLPPIIRSFMGYTVLTTMIKQIGSPDAA